MVPLLKGIRLLELSTVVMGPLAGQILADLGAEVVKLEALDGDIARNTLPQGEGQGENQGDGAMFVNNNRNKRTIAIDLKSAAGREIVRKLIARSDGLLINMRPVAAQRLGLGFDEVSKLNPDLVYCAVIGFGEAGPYRGRPAFDDVIQAAGGMADVGRHEDEPPRFAATIVADKIGALHAAYAFLGALTAKARGHKGPLYVEVPMFETLAAFILNEHLCSATFETDGQVGYSRILSRNRRPFRSLDGWIAVLPYTGEQWRRFLLEVARTDLVSQPWFNTPESRNAHIDELYAAVSAAISTRTNSTWCEVLTRLDIPYSPVASIQDLLTDPHLSAIGFFEPGPTYPASIKRKLAHPVTFRGIAAVEDQPPHGLGANTRAVLQECGYSDTEIDAMLQRREIAQRA
ncbi:MAG: CoA transferase [Proteobacteria bacterium]|nr:CoA transferase [Pseudomonadota bacterium]